MKCLAEAIYFEARSESERGRIAVAQVVLNRLKNPGPIRVPPAGWCIRTSTSATAANSPLPATAFANALPTSEHGATHKRLPRACLKTTRHFTLAMSAPRRITMQPMSGHVGRAG